VISKKKNKNNAKTLVNLTGKQKTKYDKD